MPLSEVSSSFRGRISRTSYWLGTLLNVVVSIILLTVLLVATQGAGPVYLVGTVLFIPVVVMGCAIGAKRLHDRNRSAWWLSLFYGLPTVLDGLADAAGPSGVSALAVLVSGAILLWTIAELGCLRGTAGPNRYGPDPLETRAPVRLW